MKLTLFALAAMLPVFVVGCGTTPSPSTCQWIKSTYQISFPPPMAAGSGDTIQCISIRPILSEQGAARCVAFHATKATGAACACPADQGLQDVSATHKVAVGEFFDEATNTSVVPGCVCEIKQIPSDDGEHFEECQKDPGGAAVLDSAGTPVNGYCYFGPADPHATATRPPPGLNATCSPPDVEGLRFVGRPATKLPDDLSVKVICESDPCYGGL